MDYLTILGSTGSIGQSTVSVVQQHRDKFAVLALVARNNVAIMIQQCLMLSPKYVCMTCCEAAEELKKNLILGGKNDIQVLSGMEKACELASLDEVNTVMSAMTGIVGLSPTFAAARSGKKILLANKETLIVSGKLFLKEASKYNSIILPIDSEHNAVFQNLPLLCQKKIGQFKSLSEYGICRIILTASGGSCLKIPKEKLLFVTPDQVCCHPNWSIGRKMSVDSATMMNKGLEYIEARYLFNANSDEIEVLLHPQSIVHAMVQYSDGSFLAHLSKPDMKIPITYAMAYPNRINLNNESVTRSYVNKFLFYSNKLHFDPLDYTKYPCFQLAIDASNHSQSAIIILNAANEIAVEFFLNKRISFIEIPKIICRVLDTLHLSEPHDIEDILHIDRVAKEMTKNYITSYL